MDPDPEGPQHTDLAPDADPQLSFFVRTVFQVLNFSVAYDSVLHGLGGYFECTLYKDIMLSILPATHSPGIPINVL
jgi:hypothetical protein